MSVVLMYHALHRGEDTGAIEAEDLPYALAERDFVAQLDSLVALGLGHRPGEAVGATAVGTGRLHAPVLITFDDGHASNHDIALPHLLERGLHARFFVTSGFVGRRPHFCSAEQIRALAAAGMGIGSHGATHAFLDDLAPEAAARELGESRDALERMSGAAVDTLSFPGGRWNRRTLELASGAGYARLFDSRPDTVDGTALDARRPIPRVAVRRRLPLAEFRRIVSEDAAWFRRRRAAARLKRGARTVLGNRIYHGLYQSFS